MTSRTDLVTDFSVSPRITEVAAPSAELTLQDAIDTLRDTEYTFQGMSFPHLINAFGKQNLGGGVKVGITGEAQNDQVAFQARTTSISIATVTTADVNGKTLIDSTATFVTDGVGRGDLVINFTDRSMGSVVSVTSETELIIDGLTGGVDNRFDVSDVCKVYDVVQCNISGGNFVSVDDLGADLDPVFPTFGTQIVRTAASSATLQEQKDIEFSSFTGGVTIDVVDGVSGTTFPTGTLRRPVNNLTDAKSIANSRGLDKFFIIGDLTLIASDNVDGFEFIGQDLNKTKLTIISGASTELTEFENMTITGNVSGVIVVRDCIMDNVDNLGSTTKETIIFRSKFPLDTYSINPLATKSIDLVECRSGVLGHGGPTFDFAGASIGMTVRGWNGGIKFANITAGQDNSIDIDQGHITVEASCTSGTLVVHGVTMFDDFSTGTFNFDVDGIVNQDTIADQVWNELAADHLVAASMGEKLDIISQILRNKLVTDPATGVMTLYDDLGAVLFTANVFEDAAGAQSYRGKGAERRERFT